MYCRHCGAEISDEAAYCPECGQDIQAPDEENGSQSQTPGSQPTGRQQASEAGQTRQDAPQQPAGGTRTDPPQQSQPRQQAAHGQPQTTEQNRSTTRLLAIGGAGLALIALFLPWVSAQAGGFSGSGMELQVMPIAAGAVAVAGIPPILGWGDGWGRLSSLISGIGGVAVGGFGIFMMTALGRTVTVGTVTVRGQDIPIAAVEPGTGIFVFVIAGAVILLTAIAGLIASFR